MAEERLRYRVLADRSGGELAFEAGLPTSPAGTWPVLDAVVTDAPKHAVMTVNQVLDGLNRGYITVTDHEVVVRPAGPAENPWMTSPSAPAPHTFHHFGTITIGKQKPVTYRVVRQPDKYLAGGSDTEPVTDDAYAAGQTEVVWHYELEREKGR